MALVKEDAQRRGVLDRHAGPLTLMRHHGMARIAQQTHHPARKVRVRVVDPEPPGPNLLSDIEVSEHLPIQLGIRPQQMLGGEVRGPPRVVGVVALLARKEAVVGEELAAVARRQDDLVPLAFLAAPVLERAVPRVVDQAAPDGLLGDDICVQAGLLRRPLLGVDADGAADGRADAICSDDEVVLDSRAVFEDDFARESIDIFALKSLAEVIVSEMNKDSFFFFFCPRNLQRSCQGL